MALPIPIPLINNNNPNNPNSSSNSILLLLPPQTSFPSSYPAISFTIPRTPGIRTFGKILPHSPTLPKTSLALPQTAHSACNPAGSRTTSTSSTDNSSRRSRSAEIPGLILFAEPSRTRSRSTGSPDLKRSDRFRRLSRRLRARMGSPTRSGRAPRSFSSRRVAMRVTSSDNSSSSSSSKASFCIPMIFRRRLRRLGYSRCRGGLCRLRWATFGVRRLDRGLVGARRCGARRRTSSSSLCRSIRIRLVCAG